MRLSPLPLLPVGLLVLAACATTGRSPADPSGVYHFEAWSGEWANRGTLVLRSLDGGWTGRLEFDGSPALEAVRVSYDDGSLVFVAEGGARLVRIVATVTGGRIDGTWSSGDSSGTFVARRQTFGSG